MRLHRDTNYYAVLGVLSSASHDEIKRAYRALVRTAHPDRGGDAEQFGIIAEAWEVLGNPGTRSDYDLELRARLRASRPYTRLADDPPPPPRPEPQPPRKERYSDEGLSEAERWKRHKRRF